MMRKRLNALKVVSLIIAIIEIAFAVFIGVSYGLNVVTVTEKFSISLLIIIFSAFLLVDLVLILWILVFVSRVRTKNNLKVSDIIGSDIEQIYDFGEIALVVTDDHNNIIWTSDLFTSRRIAVLDLNIFEWQPSLRQLDDPENPTPKVVINGREYEVKQLKDSGVYVFRDISEYEAAYQYAQDQSMVFGVYSIDNFEELSKNEEDSSSLILAVRDFIQNTAKDYRVIFKRIRQDSYFFVSNHKTFLRIEEDGFTLLDGVRKIGEQYGYNISLSGGIAHGFPDIETLNAEANKTLDIALARGGDQIVINEYGRDIRIIGAKTEAVEKRSKVKVRVLADSLESLMKASSNVLILGHAEMDMDSLGAALGIYSLAKQVGCVAHVVYDSRSIEKKTRQAFRATFSREEVNEMTCSPSDALLKVKAKTMVILVDHHNPSLSVAPKLFVKAKNIAVIDHHRKTSDELATPMYQYIEPSASSASELVAELMFYSSHQPRFTMDARIATIMLSGIILDTQGYRTKTTGNRTYEASMVLKEYGADTLKANQFLEDDFDEFLLVNNILSTLETPFPSVVVCTANDGVVDRAVLSKVANRCLSLKGIKAAFVIGQVSGKEVRISARSDSSINVQVIMEELGGGGHLASAAVVLNGVDVHDVRSSLLEVIDAHIQKAIIKD